MINKLKKNYLKTECKNCRNIFSKKNIMWILSLYGTAIGAGVLFLPINIGSGGLFYLLILIILAFPITFLSHRGLARLLLSGDNANTNLSEIIEKHFGKKISFLFSILYFFSIYPILLIYSTAITNTVIFFINSQLVDYQSSRIIIASCLIFILMLIILIGEKFIIKCMSILVFPFVLSLLFLSFYLIQFWHYSFFYELKNMINKYDFNIIKTIWNLIPIIIFSFNHSPIISSFVIDKKKECKICAKKTCSNLLFYSHMLMIITVIFFVCSCIFSITESNMMEAKKQNISILSYFAIHFQNSFLKFFGPILAALAIIKSFLGHYVGAKEGLNKIFTLILKNSKNKKRINTKSIIINILIFSSTWLSAIFNPSILEIIESLSGPIIAVILFLIPAFSIYILPNMKEYRSEKITNLFLWIIGILALSSMIYQFSFKIQSFF
ncbi:MAG: serine transporter [Wigglesworthia glossinidia]|nr:serine transporter [Wigglesworthia glossinidia]